MGQLSLLGRESSIGDQATDHYRRDKEQGEGKKNKQYVEQPLCGDEQLDF
jgi:hypothetical protein